MLLITHLDTLPESPLKTRIQARFNQLSKDTDGPLIRCSKWTRKWTDVLNAWLRLDTGKYTSDLFLGSKVTSCKHLRTDKDW